MVDIPDRELEEYSFLRLYSIDFEMAKQACDLLIEQDSDELRFCILRDIVVSYSRPFSGNRGTLLRQHRLATATVPQSMSALHFELIALRNQVFAHTDQDFRKPRVARWPRHDGGTTYPMGFQNPRYAELADRVAAIRALCVALENAVNEDIRSRERSFDRLHLQQTERGALGDFSLGGQP